MYLLRSRPGTISIAVDLCIAEYGNCLEVLKTWRRPIGSAPNIMVIPAM